MEPHPEDIQIDEALVARTIAAAAPQFDGLPVQPVASSGTDNAIYRLGNSLAFRMPRRRASVPNLEKELDWLPRLSGLPLAVPELQVRGRTETGLPFGILRWMDGNIATAERISDWQAAARDLAGFLLALHRTDTRGAPQAGDSNNRRGVAMPSMMATTLSAIALVADEIDAPRARALWDDGCAQARSGPPVWLHGDLKTDNLIARNGALCGVIDWGLAAVGDPAADYAAAWSWLDPAARSAFRDALGLQDGDWQRGKAWALYGAVIALSYYRGGRNEALCRQSRRTLSRLGLLR